MYQAQRLLLLFLILFFSILKSAELLFDRICEVLRALMIPVVGLVSPVGDCLLNWILVL